MTTITLFGHSGVRIDTIAIDPGAWTDPTIMEGAEYVLLTHSHPDHCNPNLIKNVPVYGPRDALENLTDCDTHEVYPGDEFDLGGHHVRVTGGYHAVVHPSLNRLTNTGYVIDERILHPGDEFPDAIAHNLTAIEVLFLPVSAPWMKISEAIDFAHNIVPHLALPIHDAILSPEGRGLVDGVLTATKAPGYLRPDLLTPIELPTQPTE
ncbi:MAG: MBL fold metallo-hydrolase [Corynebacterium sp.]|nr:MBL fold metallo-hydrolase [Corynebacterium sp.]